MGRYDAKYPAPKLMMWLLYETFVDNVKKFNKGYILQTSSKAHISLLNYKNPTCSIPKCQISLRMLPHN
jgi:hypothetical protein